MKRTDEAPLNEINRSTIERLNEPENTANALNAIGEEQIKKAAETLKKYKEQKSVLDSRVIKNEEWWKLRHWQYINNSGEEESVQPRSAWLFNSIMNKLADYSDNIPEANIRARQSDDVREAERLKELIPMIMEENDYEETYMQSSLSKLKNGTSVTGVFWDSGKNGIGDILIRNVDLLSFYWQPGITDLQKSRNVFVVDLVDNEALREQYPQLDIAAGDPFTLAKYIYEDYLDTSEKTAVIDWYYKKKGLLHYCKFAGNTVLFATENEPEKYPNGWYDDGEYPFVVDILFKMEGTIAGFGYIDVCKDDQEYIDRIDQAIMTNAIASAIPRYFARQDSGINLDDFLNWHKPIVKVPALSADDVQPIDVKPVNSCVLQARENKIQELKQTSGNSDVNTGTAASGVTAASAISQLIETGSKGSRHMIKGTYRAYRKIVYKVIERIRQFYDMPRYVRILNENGTERFEAYDNSGLKPQNTEGLFENYERMPVFDIEVSAQKASAYNKMSQNELAIQFYQYGFFAPDNADASLSCLKMMDFDHKDDVMQMIQQNGTLLDMVKAQQEQINKLSVLADLAYGSNISGANAQAQAAAEKADRTAGQGSASAENPFSDNETGSLAEKRRRQAADATEV